MVNIPDAAVQAAAKCYAERVVSINDTFTSLAREMLTAAYPHLQPVDVAAVTRPDAADKDYLTTRAALAQGGGK